MSKVLEGVTVLEQGTFITGPAAGMLLADLGARVIKIEQPGTGHVLGPPGGAANHGPGHCWAPRRRRCPRR